MANNNAVPNIYISRVTCRTGSLNAGENKCAQPIYMSSNAQIWKIQV